MKKFSTKIANSFQNGENGFTLLELLIVIVILGFLAAAIIPNTGKFIGNGVVGVANAELASVRTAIAVYMADSPSGTLLPTDTGAAGDLVPADITRYISGSKTVIGTYTIATDGSVTGTAYTSGITTLHWDGTPNFRWKR